MTGLPVRYGTHRALEDAANDLLRRSLSTISRHADKSDVLTPWKEADRRSREVYVSSGVADPSLRQGIFRRAYNPAQPHLNSIEGCAPPSRFDTSAPIQLDWDDE